MAARVRRGGVPGAGARGARPVADAVGRVTAGAVWASRSSPAYDAAAMDGIAVRAADTLGASETSPLLPAAGGLRRRRHGRPAARRAVTRW